MGPLWEGVLLWIRMGDSGVLCCKRGENCHGFDGEVVGEMEQWSDDKLGSWG